MKKKKQVIDFTKGTNIILMPIMIKKTKKEEETKLIQWVPFL